MFICGFRLRATPSTTTIVRCSRISSVRVCIPKRSVTSKRCASSRAIEIRVASWPKIGSPDRAQRLGEGVRVAVARHVARLEVHLRHPLVVAVQEADQDLGVDPAGIGVDPPHDAEVERDQRPVRPELQVALVHVGVEEAVAQRVGQEGLDDPLRQPHQVGAARPQRREVAEVDARSPTPASAPAGPRPARSPPAPGSPGRARCWRRTRPRPPPPSGGRARPAPRPRSGGSPPSAAAAGRRARGARSCRRRSRRRRRRAGRRARSRAAAP